ncbi:MAG: hypothetical protein N2654_01220 [Deltaproteobacteria bacterium]|nr:hypothetical protein [Deltaproteobacteria bacterium]
MEQNRFETQKFRSKLRAFQDLACRYKALFFTSLAFTCPSVTALFMSPILGKGAAFRPEQVPVEIKVRKTSLPNSGGVINLHQIDWQNIQEGFVELPNNVTVYYNRNGDKIFSRFVRSVISPLYVLVTADTNQLGGVNGFDFRNAVIYANSLPIQGDNLRYYVGFYPYRKKNSEMESVGDQICNFFTGLVVENLGGYAVINSVTGDIIVLNGHNDFLTERARLEREAIVQISNETRQPKKFGWKQWLCHGVNLTYFWFRGYKDALLSGTTSSGDKFRFGIPLALAFIFGLFGRSILRFTNFLNKNYGEYWSERFATDTGFVRSTLTIIPTVAGILSGGATLFATAGFFSEPLVSLLLSLGAGFLVSSAGYNILSNFVD